MLKEISLPQRESAEPTNKKTRCKKSSGVGINRKSPEQMPNILKKIISKYIRNKILSKMTTPIGKRLE